MAEVYGPHGMGSPEWEAWAHEVLADALEKATESQEHPPVVDEIGQARWRRQQRTKP